MKNNELEVGDYVCSLQPNDSLLWHEIINVKAYAHTQIYSFYKDLGTFNQVFFKGDVGGMPFIYVSNINDKKEVAVAHERLRLLKRCIGLDFTAIDSKVLRAVLETVGHKEPSSWKKEDEL